MKYIVSQLKIMLLRTIVFREDGVDIIQIVVGSMLIWGVSVIVGMIAIDKKEIL